MYLLGSALSVSSSKTKIQLFWSYFSYYWITFHKAWRICGSAGLYLAGVGNRGWRLSRAAGKMKN